MKFLKKIEKKMPCPIDDIFKGDVDQVKVYENFVYLLHLLQAGLIKYQNETEFIYLE